MRTIEKKKMKCEKHGTEFEGRLLFGKIKVGCPLCAREQEAQRQAKEAQRQRQKEQELQEYKDFRVKCSGLGKRLIETKAKYTQNFKEFSKHLKSLEKNLYLYGNVGTGKSMFCAELIKRNTDKMPLYFLASDLAYLTKSKCVEILNAQSTNNCGLFIIDEISDLPLIDESFLNALIDKLYNNDCLFVLSGNVSKDFLNSLSLKVLSRLNARGLELCEFSGEDLRISKNR